MTSGTGSVDDGSANNLPSPAQLALALAVIRSKPPDMSIEGQDISPKQTSVLISSRPY